MNLLFITLFLVIFAFIANIFSKYKKIFIIVSIFIVFLFYFFLSRNFYHTETFYPSKTITIYESCGNYYNLLVNSLKKSNFHIATMQNLQGINPFDTSKYKGKLYLYFGLTPLLMFYIPFHLITSLYLTDKFLVFILGCITFLLHLLLLKIFMEKLKIKSQTFIIILSIFLIGICNYAPFLIIRGVIYEVCIFTAIICLLISILILLYLNEHSKYKRSLISLLGLLLALCVGTRPQYILFIPVFYLTLLYVEYHKNNKTTNFYEITFLFFTPCIIYGIILATYNFLRFDSFFEFGWRYQFNDLNQRNYVQNFNNILISLKYNLFAFPKIGTETIFSLIRCTEHSRAKEFVTGIIYSFPLILDFVFISYFMKQLYNKTIFIYILLFIFIVITNFITTGLITGIVLRYVFEYLSFMVIISLLIFCYLLDKQKNNLHISILYILFAVIFIFSIYINISLLFCEESSLAFNIECANNYEKTIKFLF